MTNGNLWPEATLRKAEFDRGYTGWVFDFGDGTCRFANQPLLGEDEEGNPRFNWGDKVPLQESGDGFPVVVHQLLERYEPDGQLQTASTEEAASERPEFSTPGVPGEDDGRDAGAEGEGNETETAS